MILSVRQILGVGLIIFLLTSFTSIGYHHSDEHWQLLEFANYKHGRSPQHDLASEYAKEMRAAFQPAVAYLGIQFLESLHITNPFDVAFALRLFTSILGWLALATIVGRCKELGVSESNQKLLACVSMFLWFMPYTTCRFSNENWSGFLLCFGILAIALNHSHKWKYFLVAGVLVGLSYQCRFQIAFAVVGLVAWMAFIKKCKVSSLLLFLLGFSAMVFTGVLFDYWFYGHFTFTAYHYFYANIIEGVAASFGISPWWYYFNMIFESAAAPMSMVILAGYLYSIIKSPKHIFHWVVFFFLAGHCLVGHKELRFLFPMIYFLPLILVLAFEKLVASGKTALSRNKFIKIFVGLTLVENAVLLCFIVLIKPAEETTLFNRFVYTLASRQPVTIFYAGNDPYQFGDQRQYFYAPKNLSLVKIESESTIKNYNSPTGTLLLVYDNRFYPSENIKSLIGAPVFKTFPTWLSKVNVGNWLARAKAWSLYEVKTTSLPPQP